MGIDVALPTWAQNVWAANGVLIFAR